MRIFIDHSGVRRYERTGDARKVTQRTAHVLAQKAEHNLRSRVEHDEHPITPPEAATNFKVVPTVEGARVVNDDPIILLLEFGYHPGGGSTFVGPYAPFRRALDEMG